VCQDDPRATQPLTYQKILNHPTTLQTYSQKLLHEGIITQEVRPYTFLVVLTSLDQKVTLLLPIFAKFGSGNAVDWNTDVVSKISGSEFLLI
jgi:hypothetical protein